MSGVRYFKSVRPDAPPEPAQLDEGLLHDDPQIRRSARLHATDALETITKWMNDELARDPTASGVTTVIKALTVTHMQIVASVLGQCAPDDPALAKALVSMQGEIAEKVIERHCAAIGRALAAQRGSPKANRPSGPSAGSEQRGNATQTASEDQT